MKKLVILTGAGISAESGLKTFRDSDGLWEGYDINEVATPEGWRKNPELVQEFYNMRRKAVVEAEPNAGHFALAELQNHFETVIITQNIDNLHEKAGSKNVIHLHGIITKSQSSLDPKLVYDIEGFEIKMGERCEKGSQLRPHVVWFGESVPMIEPAAYQCMQADLFAVIGTSLQVYPAAGLMDYVPFESPKFLIDPNAPYVSGNVRVIKEKASVGVPQFANLIINEFS
ncbi:NAD-dependent deacylase [Solitalea sp. MAHUQ-68]|uniref:NAD-dependent protein deacylase n=1 Tax=Solitalea agri TaxID=2953739 RepID=A0A9X2JEC9_9SPHI|nr:NAD-dependent deacylase [Solitalea agri]MCO4293830.1 NAD-dependent deacylase [Solitalea agri]